MRPVAVAILLMFATSLSGCILEEALDRAADELLGRSRNGSAVLFAPPVKLNAAGYGYEPSIEVDSAGTLYVTAHKASLTNEGTRLASWLWYSADQGASWQEMPTPAQFHDKLFAFEGDLAVDARDRIYYVDTYLADNTLHRWSPGPTWDYSRPIHGTGGVDDRPWLAAHGDGIVYYLGNNGAALPALNNLLDEGGSTARIWVYVSEDGGMTWSTGHGFAASGWCGIAASPADDRTVYVGCDRYAGGGTEMVVWRSEDRGATWSETVVADLRGVLAAEFPSIAVDRAGNAYLAWIDEHDAGSDARVARSIANGKWEVLDVTPFRGSFERVWISGGNAGTVAVTFYGTQDLPAGESSEWRAYAAVSHDADAPVPSWSHGAVDDQPVTVGPTSPGDFFQNVIGADNLLHVIYQRETAQADLVGSVVNGYQCDILYAKQTMGPNLA